jgi:hypothetical protein
VIVHSEVEKKRVEMAFLNIYRLRKTAVTSILTGAVLAIVDWLTSQHVQLLNCPAWYFHLLHMRYGCPFYHVTKQGILVTYFVSGRMFCSSCNA